MTGLVKLLCVSLCSVVWLSMDTIATCYMHHVRMMCWPSVGNCHMVIKDDNDGVAPILGDASTVGFGLRRGGRVGGGGGVLGWGELEKLEKWDRRDLFPRLLGGVLLAALPGVCQFVLVNGEQGGLFVTVNLRYYSCLLQSCFTLPLMSIFLSVCSSVAYRTVFASTTFWGAMMWWS